MSKKITKTPRVSLKQKFEAYRVNARSFINAILYPTTKPIFSIAAYSEDKKPNAASVPELLAIVGTAAKLNQQVQVRVSGINELQFIFVSQPNFPEWL